MIRAAVLAAAIALGACTPVAMLWDMATMGRPTEDLNRDDLRKPAETLAFAGVRPGWTIGEYMPGGGYFTRIFSSAVGPEGRVYAYQPAEIVRLRGAYLTEIQAVAAEPGRENIIVSTGETRDFATPGQVDMVFTAQNYHDLHGPFAARNAPADFNAAVMRALKPGGVYLIIDHAAVDGSGLAGAAREHRIEKSALIAEITAAGFVLEAESEALANPADPRTASVFDASIRGHTDQFMLRFRKPG